MKKKKVSAYPPRTARLDPREVGTGPSPKVAVSVSHALKDRLRVIALARVQGDEARARGEVSVVVREQAARRIAATVAAELEVANARLLGANDALRGLPL